MFGAVIPWKYTAFSSEMWVYPLDKYLFEIA